MTLTFARFHYILRLFPIAAVALVTAAFPPYVRAQDPLLDVPYLPQSEALCGGAAIAMVMRYWGATGVYAETFTDLVDVEARGIHTRDLTRALEVRGYEAASFEGSLDQVRRTLAARSPAIVLIQDRPGRFHYVVIVGVRGDRIVVHDPARAPYRVVQSDEFLRSWAPAGYWTLVARPEANAVAPSASTVEAAPAEAQLRSVCAGLVDEGVRLSGRGELEAAERVLQLAASECSHDPAPLRELAGVYVIRGEWTLAAKTASEALERNSHDQHAIRTLATSLFVTGQRERALDAWNEIDAPVVDLVEIRGLEQTRFNIAAGALDLRPQTLLTRGRLDRARRRLDALPSLMASRVTYEPDERDRAKVVAAVIERPVLPTGIAPAVAIGVRAITDGELRVNVAGPTGGAELWTGAWRWWEKRPRVELGLAAPSPFGGIWSVTGFTERQTYGSDAAQLSERRRGVALQASDWVTGSTRVLGGISIDRWPAGLTTSVRGGVARSFDGGRGTATFEGMIVGGALQTAAVTVDGEWQSTLDRLGSVWHARAGLTTVGRHAPLALWPGAGVGQGRDVLLRAHSLIHDGVIRGVFGRQVSHAGVEWRYWRRTIARTLRVAPAAFLDVARASEVPSFGDARLHMDVGVGLRVVLPGAGVVRVDFGHGLRDGRNALSVGWAR